MRLSTPFFTAVDSRAAVKGSRDPLGFQAIWSRLGRLVVGNLTMASNSVRDFTVLLTGLHLAERVRGQGEVLTGFLIFEQIAAYARWHVLDDKHFRGIDRVGRRLREDDRVTLGLADECQILSNQKTYGLWGLYLNPARASGLIASNSTTLSEPIAAMVDQELIPVLESQGARVLASLQERMAKQESRLRVSDDGPDKDLLLAVAKVLKSIYPRQKRLLREHLVLGGPNDVLRGTAGCQALLAHILRDTQGMKDWGLSRHELLRLAKIARRSNDSHGGQLAQRLDQIRTIEALLGMSALLFDHLLQHHNQSVEVFAKDVHARWGRAPQALLDLTALRQYEPYLRSQPDDEESGRRLLALAEHLHAGDYGATVSELVRLNAQIMRRRGSGGAWVDLHQGIIVIRSPQNSAPEMPVGDRLGDYWRHPYFIDSLREVAKDLQDKP